MTQQHLEPALDRQITQPLQHRASQHCARDALILEHQILADKHPGARAANWWCVDTCRSTLPPSKGAEIILFGPRSHLDGRGRREAPHHSQRGVFG